MSQLPRAYLQCIGTIEEIFAMKRTFIGLFAFLSASLTTALLSPAALADKPGEHPAYLHALEDLRHARGHLERPANVTPLTGWDERVAIAHIDDAIREIKQAAIDDGKNLADHPAIDVALDWSGRLHRTVELLRKARADVGQDEDNRFARGLRNRAFGHIDAAIHYVEQGIAANGPVAQAPGKHPAYLHALEDLRHARGHLERPATVTNKTRWDERVAISEIDAAIHEIKQAAIDDGKNLADHPPVDVAMDWPGRLHRSAELLRKARADVNEEEDNA